MTGCEAKDLAKATASVQKTEGSSDGIISCCVPATDLLVPSCPFRVRSMPFGFETRLKLKLDLQVALLRRCGTLGDHDPPASADGRF